MELNNKQKEIMNLMVSQEVDDIPSFVVNFLKAETFKYDKKEIERKKKNDYYNNKENIDEYLRKVKKVNVNHSNGISFYKTDYSSNEIEEMRKKLSDYSVNHSDFLKNIELKGENFKINTLTQKVYVAKNLYNELLDFLSLWNVLESNQLIVTVPKDVTYEDAKVFFIKHTNVDDTSESPTKQSGILDDNQSISHEKLKDIKFNFELPFDPKHFYKKNDKDYSEVDLSLEKKSLTIAESYIDKKIVIAPSLITFLKDGFQISEEKKYRSEKKRSNFAIATSIIIALISFFMSYALASSNTKFWEENEEKREIQFKEMNDSLSNIYELLNENEQNLEGGFKDINDKNENMDQEINQMKNEVNKIKSNLEILQNKQ